MKIVNRSTFLRNLERRLVTAPRKNVRSACLRSANVVRETAVKSISQGVKTGATTIKYNPRREHTASAAGEPPATDTGFLVNSITSGVVKEGNAFVGEVKASAPYAIHLEFGTTRMSARPFFQPALQQNERKIEGIFLQEGVIK